MNLFNLQEKKMILRTLGYEVKKAKLVERISCYHNDVEYEDYVIDGVFKDGKDVGMPNVGYGRVEEEDWINNVFIPIQTKFFRELFLNHINKEVDILEVIS